MVKLFSCNRRKTLPISRLNVQFNISDRPKFALECLFLGYFGKHSSMSSRTSNQCVRYMQPRVDYRRTKPTSKSVAAGGRLSSTARGAMGLSSFKEVKTHMCLVRFVILPSHLDMMGKTLGAFSLAVSIKTRTVFKDIEWILAMIL